MTTRRPASGARDASDAPPRDPKTPYPDGSRKALRTIAVFKGLKALVLILAGLGALGLLNNGQWDDLVRSWLDDLALHEGRRFVARFASKAADMLGDATPRRLALIGLASFGYAAIFVAEGVGLWLGKRWAEILTIVVTGSFLPFEAMSLMKHRTPVHAITLALNALIVAYLVSVLVRKRRGEESMREGRIGAADPVIPESTRSDSGRVR